MTGQYMDAWSKSGALTRTYSPNDLGDNIYSISILNELNDVPPGNGNGGGSGGGGGGCNAGLGFAGLAAMTGLIIRARREKRK
jgi:hypothetical protein